MKKITDGLNIINQLDPLIYYKTRNFYEHNKIFASDEIPEDAILESGYIAQEIKKIPELTHLVTGNEYDSSNNSTSLHLNYIGIQPYLCKAIQELHTLVKTQQATIESLQTAVQSLQNS